MDQFKYFHLCTHKEYVPPIPTLKIKTFECPVNNVFLESADLQISLLDSENFTYKVSKILFVLVTDAGAVTNPEDFNYDNNNFTFEDIQTEEGFFDFPDDSFYVDYALYSNGTSKRLSEDFYELKNNQLVWKKRPPLKYTVYYNIEPFIFIEVRHAPLECPICNGYGWYFDLVPFQQTTVNVFGVERIIQRIVKDLLIEKGENMFDIEYGGDLTRVLKDYGQMGDTEIENRVRYIVDEVRTEYLQRQAQLIDQLEDDEILVSLNFLRFQRIDNTKIVVEIAIRTNAGEQAFRIPV
jgi:hypothetical protein